MAAGQQPRFGQMLRRLMNLKQSYSPDVVDTLMPTIETRGPIGYEDYRLRGEDLVGSGTMFAAASVGNESTILISVPAGRMLVVTKIFYSLTNTVNQLSLAWANVPLAGAGIAWLYADGRQSSVASTGSGPLWESRTNIGPFGTPLYQFSAADQDADCPMVVPGGQNFAFQPAGLNVGINFLVVQGYIRDLEPSEKF